MRERERERERAYLRLVLQGDTLTSQDEDEMLGVTYDSNKLTFRSHIGQLAREASGKLASLKRISHLLNSLIVIYMKFVFKHFEC